ncbi:MAG: hypothetical protein J0I49_04355 [Pseudonocardia sp.]|uniref:hypothetical protein n=1 Tax=Pseudonocardia sp. TaxID=60912 RepID=UPI001AD22E66|nr:hypothetical protein [Pseudonocardia sp.]MBN9097334.1 hypothetical protein [Pseudonocardia sp.]
MRTSQWIGGVAATAVTVGALVVGGGTAFADTPAPTPAPAAGSNQQVCTVRIPKLLTKIDSLTATINGPATTKGSTAWLQAREDKARAAGHTAAADLLQDRITDRAQRLTELAGVKSQVLAVQSKDCGS